MAKKRFTDVEIWNKEWFMDLTPKLKCLIRYLFDNCDAAGVWTPNWKLASLHIGEEVNEKHLRLLPDDQYEIFDGKIFLPDFINFQYGQLSESSPAHKPVFASLKKHNLSDRVFNRVSNTLQDKAKDKDKDKEEDKDKDFGKSENLFEESALVPQMAKVFKEKNGNYTPVQENDFPALKQIANFICKQTGISFQPRDGDVQKMILDSWLIISEWIADHRHYSNHNLQQISKYIQSISTEIKNGKSGSKNTNGHSSKATSTGLNKVFAKRYGQGAA
jgi:hypothetical protein